MNQSLRFLTPIPDQRNQRHHQIGRVSGVAGGGDRRHAWHARLAGGPSLIEVRTALEVCSARAGNMHNLPLREVEVVVHAHDRIRGRLTDCDGRLHGLS